MRRLPLLILFLWDISAFARGQDVVASGRLTMDFKGLHLITSEGTSNELTLLIIPPTQHSDVHNWAGSLPSLINHAVAISGTFDERNFSIKAKSIKGIILNERQPGGDTGIVSAK